VAHAYRNGSGTLSSGQASITMSYDGKGRRVKKAITNSGQWDATHKYYYDNDSLVEMRNGSDDPLKQHALGGAHKKPDERTYVYCHVHSNGVADEL